MNPVSPAAPPGSLRLGHSLRLEPGPRGHRYNLDAFLLADFASLSEETFVADLGTGSGVVGILLAFKHPRLHVEGIDLQWPLLRLAASNAGNCGLAGRVEPVRADLRKAGSWAKPGRFDAAVINPPYQKAGTGRLSPDPVRAMARHEVTLDLSAWLEAARHLIAPGGRLFVTHLAEREDEVVRRMEERGFGLRRF
ncbi:MAG: tRNA1(Val) (adenine(37)-N6)-methyltransferase, partial [Nitrospinota bacterium]